MIPAIVSVAKGAVVIEKHFTLSRKLPRIDQNASIEKLDVLDEFLGRLELEFGKPGDKKSIADKVTALKSAFQTLSSAPESSSNALALVTAADDLARSFNSFNNFKF